MATSSIGIHLFVLFLFCVCCRWHALFASAASISNLTSSHSSIAAVPGHGHGVVNTTVTDEAVPATDLFEGAPPPLWSKLKTSWPSMNGFSSSTFVPKYKARVGDHVASNRSNIQPPHPLNGEAALRGVRHRRLAGKSGGGASRSRKSLCVFSYHRRPSLLHAQVECSGVGVIVVAGSALLLLLLCSLAVAVVGLQLLRCVLRKRRRGEIADPEDDDSRDRPALLRAAGPRRYSYSTLAAATSNFAECRRIGRGGFGWVYRGFLGDQDRDVAVKTFSAATGSLEHGRKEFDAEVEVMSQLRHRNVVQLVGWSDGHRGLVLVYELVPGGSLHKHLHDPIPGRLLTWPERYKIALDLGAAVAFDERQMERVLVTGLWCTGRDRSRRPSITEAMDVLRSANSEIPVLPAVGGCGEIHALEELAYGGLSTEDDGDGSTISPSSTAYLSPEDSQVSKRSYTEARRPALVREIEPEEEEVLVSPWYCVELVRGAARRASAMLLR